MDNVLIAIIAFITSAFSGMLGLGGAVVLIPAYLYIPPLFGLQSLDVKSISGVTSLQVFASALLGMLLHSRRGAVHTRLVLIMGIPITLASFSGAMVSGIVSPDIILVVFAVMAIFGAVLMLVRRAGDESGNGNLTFSTAEAIGVATGVGFFGGMVGAPGAFLLAPLMMTVLNIPTRITIGSTLGIVVLSAFAASVGKIATGQVPLVITFVAILASLPGVYIGSRMSHRAKPKTLRWILALFISGVGVQMLYRILF